MAEMGLSAPVYQDVSNYEVQVRVLGARLPKRMALALGAGVAASASAGAYVVFVLGLDVSAVSYLFPIIATPCFLAGFWRPRGLMPEYWLPRAARGALRGRHLTRTSPCADFDTDERDETRHVPLNEGVKLDATYAKDIRKRGARTPEIYLSRLADAQAGSEEGAETAQEG